MRVHLVDGTYELFRAYFGAPKALSPSGGEVGATRGLMRSVLALLGEPGVTHVACAFDHVIESFRNTLFPGYKTSEGVPEDLLSQFELAERAVSSLGIVSWPMVEFEADDALATAAHRFGDAPGVEQVLICTPDKDMAQCVKGSQVVCFDRMRRKLLDEDAVFAKFGVGPASIPDFLALVGDQADGIPGVPRFGSKSAAAVLSRYLHLEAIPEEARAWDVTVRGADALGQSLKEHKEDALLYRRLATLALDVPLTETLDDLRWRGPRKSEAQALCRSLGDDALADRIAALP